MKEYTIKKGKHSAQGLHINLNCKKTRARYMVVFDEDCKHKPIENDWNKLVGWTFNILPLKPWFKKIPAHHYNSIRIGWRTKGNGAKQPPYIEICLYVYINGVRRKCIFPEKLEYGQPYFLELGLENGHAYLKGTHTNGFSEKVDVKWGEIKLGYGYDLFPYYGGNYAAPQDMSIRILEY